MIVYHAKASIIVPRMKKICCCTSYLACPVSSRSTRNHPLGRTVVPRVWKVSSLADRTDSTMGIRRFRTLISDRTTHVHTAAMRHRHGATSHLTQHNRASTGYDDDRLLTRRRDKSAFGKLDAYLTDQEGDDRSRGSV